MDILLWILILIYIFIAGYWIAAGVTRLIRRNPKAFPGSHRIRKPPKPVWEQNWGSDETCTTCYNKGTNCKECEHHEVSHP